MSSARVGQLAAWVVFVLSAAMVATSLPMDVWVAGRVDAAALMFSVAFIAVPVAGIVIARRQPGNRIAWLLLAVGLVIGVGAVADPYARYGLTVRPGSLPGAGVVAAISGSLWVPSIGIIGTYLILLFPDGRLPSRRWRPVAWISAAIIAMLTLTFLFGPGTLEQVNPDVDNPLAIAALEPLLPVMLGALPVLPLCMLASAISLVLRFRRSSGIERQQVKWLASAAALVASVYLLGMLFTWYFEMRGKASPRWLDAYDTLSVSTFVLIPVAIGIAVLRYGLYGIDRLISRTLSYAVITGTLLVVYLLLVTTVSRIAPSSSSLAVAGSTLTVAALFQPLRRRVQTVVDRKFNRARYDAERTVEAFTRTLRAEVDLDAVSSDLIATVHNTLEPAQIGLWLRPSRGSS